MVEAQLDIYKLVFSIELTYFNPWADWGFNNLKSEKDFFLVKAISWQD